jgi:hypothetical protein
MAKKPPRRGVKVLAPVQREQQVCAGERGGDYFERDLVSCTGYAEFVETG